MIRQTMLCAALASLFAAQAGATTIPVAPDGQWYEFDVDESLSSSGGLEWIDGITGPSGYEGDGSALTFTFTLNVPGTLTIVDAGQAGDVFNVNVNGNVYPTSVSNDPDSTSVGSNFDAALSDSHRYSQLVLPLAAGSYSVTGLLIESALGNTGQPLNATVGGLKVTAVPLPAAWGLFLAAGSWLGSIARRRPA